MPSPSFLIVAVLCAVFAVGAGASRGPLYGVAALVVVVASFECARRVELAGLLLVATVPALSGIKRGFPVPGLRLSELLIVLLGSLILAFGRKGPRWTALDWFALAYAGATLTMGITAMRRDGVPTTTASLGRMLTPLALVVFFRAIVIALPRVSDRQAAARAFLWSSVPVSALAILQYLGVAGVRGVLARFVDSDNFAGNAALGFQSRATGPFSHWHSLAGYLLPVLLVCWALLLFKEQAVIARRQLILIFTLAAAALLLTFTFAGYFGFVAGAVLVAAWAGQLRRLLPLLLTGAAMASLLVAPSLGARLHDQYTADASLTGKSYVPQTVRYRFAVWSEQYLPALDGRWVSGYGPVLPDSIEWKYSESLYVSLLFRGGLPLLLVYLGLVCALLSASRRRFNDDDVGQAAVARALAAIVIVLIPMHTVFPYFIDSGLPEGLWAVAGLAFASIPLGARSASKRRIVAHGSPHPARRWTIAASMSWPASHQWTPLTPTRWR